LDGDCAVEEVGTAECLNDMIAPCHPTFPRTSAQPSVEAAKTRIILNVM
jgi:hypothetical protein